MILGLLYVVVLLYIVSLYLGDQVPDDVKMYFADDYAVPILGGLLVWIRWKQIL